MKVYCPALLSGKYFPNKFAHVTLEGGQNISPPVLWGEVPPDARSFVLSIVDLHPAARNWIHWFVINIPRHYREIPEHASGDRERFPSAAQEMRNSFGDLGYGGPNPLRGSGLHPYEFTVRALSIDSLSVGPFATPQECEEEMRGKVLASGSMKGYLQR
jgi:Raf kinase inhibitor-like YbhB/YbcL family protein